MADPLGPLAYGAGPRRGETDDEPRCWRCGRMVAWLVTRPWKVQCPRCRAINQRGITGSPDT